MIRFTFLFGAPRSMPLAGAADSYGDSPPSDVLGAYILISQVIEGRPPMMIGSA